MRARNSIKLDEQNHRDNLERVHEATRLAFSLRESYEQRQSFNREDLKRLERLEKLVRKVRSEAGGEDAAEELDKYPNGVGETLTLLARMTDELCDQVEKTPRQVISASIVVCANEIIQVVKQLRKQVAQ